MAVEQSAANGGPPALAPTRSFVGPSLARRIVIAFTLMGTIIAGLFSAGVVIAIELAEIHLVFEGMERQLDFAIANDQAGPSFNHISANLYLYRTGAPSDPPLPDWLHDYGPGNHEIDHENFGYLVLVRDHNGRRYILLLDHSDFAHREQLTFSIAGIGFLLSVLIAFGLGLLLARRVIAPVTRLAGQVQHRDQLLPLAPSLAPDYPNDEVGQLAAAFDHTLGRLRQALQRETLFTSDVSHELRTPLMIIASSCELLLDSIPPNSHEHAQLLRLQSACEEMRELLETFLCLARGNTPAARNNNIALPTAAADQIGHWKEEAQRRGLALELENHAATSDDVYPAPLLRTVISNLLRNAIHYTERGEVRLILHADGFDVSDTGVGIPPNEQLSIFQPYVRGGTSRGDGIGLGLSLVQRICQQQGWRVWLSERSGGGCVFHIRFLPEPVV